MAYAAPDIMKILKAFGKLILILLSALLALAAAVLMFLRFWPSVGKLPGRAEQETFTDKTARFFSGSFHNLTEIPALTGRKSYDGRRKTPQTVIPAQTPALKADPGEGTLTFTWLGHSSFLLQMGDRIILADPVFSDRCSPVSFAGPKRFSQLPLTAEELPEIDVVFLSHDHYDHLDYRTVRALKDKAGVFVTPLGMDATLRGWGVAAEKIRPLDWWESAELDGVTVTLTPSRHFSGRDPFRRNAVLWGGLFLDDGFHKVYYTGDGGYNDVFRSVGERLGAPDLMLTECGQYDPAWAGMHMFPEESVRAARDTGAGWMIPVHWGSFCICNHDWDDPIRRVTAAAEAQGQPLAAPRIGQTVDFTDAAFVAEPWWEAYE